MSGGFLERWSRRKADETQGAAEPDETAPAPEAETDAQPPISDEELAALPRIEDLTPESSLAPFLRAGVPSGLKNAAMRKMWLLTPAIRDHNDCAVDYHWDWNTPGGVPGSGGRLEPEAVQKMLKGLTEPRPAAAIKPATEPAKKPDAAGEAPPETTAETQATASDDMKTEVSQAPVSENGSAASPTDPAHTERRKRHGGAMPS